jgi:hypothetical protein
MARKKDLGGLAALAGLAYMASRDKAAKGDMPTGDDQYNPDVKQRSAAAPDMGEIRDEAGTLSTLRRNTETGEMYDPTGSSASTAPSRPAASRSTAPAASKPSTTALKDDQYNADVKTRTTPDSVDVTKLSLAERAKINRERARSEGTKTDSRSVNERMRDSLGLKKGGSVKGWGISRGARKAKIY